MNTLHKLIITLILCCSVTAWSQNKYRCMVQMTNYTGEGAYLVISLVNPEGKYQQTLYMMGDDPEWYDSLKQWFSFYYAEKTDIDAITGASITGGDRKSVVLEIDADKLDKGYKIRFETAVEDQKYYVTDAEVPFTSQGITSKTEGKGYIRYVKFIKVE